MADALTGSASLTHPDYWWYRARTALLETALASYMGDPARSLDVGSADGPSVAWMTGDQRRFTLDVDPRGLAAGEGVCGSAAALPFRDASFDLVGAFDVVEHCESEAQAMAELARVLAPGGRLLLSVPAYQWAWSDHDVRAGHFRRYTRPRIVRALRGAGLEVDRATYAFTSVFPFFVAERAARRVRQLRGSRPPAGIGQVSPAVDRMLMALSRVDQRLLRSRDLPFGSSVFVAAHKPAHKPAHGPGSGPGAASGR
ncbi:MAG TPA: class I SAM-dependent methyltransferase [Nocardioidaceae bacterium]|nr:class I SAM-dependent methyltransferase [Nocardioidaceae bacterium]